MYIVTEFGTDWFIFADTGVYKQSQIQHFFSIGKANNSDCSSAMRPIIKLILHLMVTYISTKFDDDD